MEKLASISIITSNRQVVSSQVNALLTDNGHIIMSRLGVNVQKSCTEHCPGMILLAIKGDEIEINQLFEALKEIAETSVKMSIFEDSF